VTPKLNIAALTRRTGVPPDTIRKWEQRYGVLQPERTSGGQRRYTELDVARVEWLKARLDEGFRIGEAAALLGDTTLALGDAQGLPAAIVDAARRSDVAALGTAVEQALFLPSLEKAFEEVFSPALVEIGELWRAGELTVAQEHLASGTIRSALQRLLADHRGNVRGVAVLACAPGELHEIGLLMVALQLRADGWQVAYLGADTPVTEALALATQLGASALLFSVTREEPGKTLAAQLSAADVPARLTILVGGSCGGGGTPTDAVRSLRKAAA
jgi:MerR family transcriptional regulator, light-induced transcriptional regulator